MARIPTVDPALAAGRPKSLLDAVKAKLGLVPNMTKVMATAPAVLEGYLGFSGALAGGDLPPRLREQIAVLVAENNACTYCLSAHTAIGKIVGLSPAELAAARHGDSSEAKTAAALRFAQRVLVTTGAITDEDVVEVRAAGYSDTQIAEIIAHVGLNTFTNLFNKAAAVEVDFPRVEPAPAAACRC